MITSLQDKMRARRAGACEEGAVEEGFTLIELMVVLLIMGILMAIAIPTFLSVTGSANDKAAQSDITNAFTNGESFYINGQTFTGYAPSSSAITYVSSGATTANAADNIVSYEVGGGGNSVAFASWAKSGSTGTCWVGLIYKGGNSTGSGLDSTVTTAGNYYGTASSSEAACVLSGYVVSFKYTGGSSWAHPQAL